MKLKQLINGGALAATVLTIGSAQAEQDPRESVVFCKATIMRLDNFDERNDVSVTLPFTVVPGIKVNFMVEDEKFGDWHYEPNVAYGYLPKPEPRLGYDFVGWYTKAERKVLMCVCTKHYSHEVFQVVKKVDPTAFVTVSNATNVYGEGFDIMKTKVKGMKPIIVFATNNENKLREVREILGERFEVRSLKEIGCFDELPETHATLEENSLEKAQYISKFYGFDCFADDTGLEVEALGGAPGVYSARYANIEDDDYSDPEMDITKDHDSEANMRKLLYKLKGRVGEERKAQFRTSIALIYQGKTYNFEGIVKGIITEEKRGGTGFGYDPIFQPDGYDTTFAEMSSEAKNSISHRGRAVEKLVEFLNSNKK